MPPEEHYRRLERMYRAAPCKAYYTPEVTIGEGTGTAALISMEWAVCGKSG